MLIVNSLSELFSNVFCFFLKMLEKDIYSKT